MLENWTYEEKPLNLMSGHYEDSSQKLPKEMLDSIVKAKNVNTGLLNLR
jgi:Zn-dependent oligopeptidase